MRVDVARRRTLGPTVFSLAAAATLAACGGSRPPSGAPVDAVARAPQLLNPEEVAEAIQAEYPSALRIQGVVGTVRLRLLVGADGVPMEIRVLGSSGNGQLDEAATRVATHLRFDPAVDQDGRPVRVWATFPITFRVP